MGLEAFSPFAAFRHRDGLILGAFSLVLNKEKPLRLVFFRIQNVLKLQIYKENLK